MSLLSAVAGVCVVWLVDNTMSNQSVWMVTLACGGYIGSRGGAQSSEELLLSVNVGTG